MKMQKSAWFVAISYSDGQVDVARTDDYEKAVAMALDTWRDECEQWRLTKVQGVSNVELFDSAGRIVWDSDSEPSGMSTSPNFERLRQLA
jgi:hypothetical protein